jgi:hypothetical protein
MKVRMNETKLMMMVWSASFALKSVQVKGPIQ